MSFNLGISKLAGIIGDIIGAVIGAIIEPIFQLIMRVVQPVVEMVLELIIPFIKMVAAIVPQTLYMIFTLIAQVADVVQILFRLMAGMSDSMVYLNEDVLGNINGQPTGNFVLDILMSNVIMSVFAKMLIVAVILLIVFTFVAIIKNEYSSEGAQNSKGKIIGKSLKALFTFLFIPVICFSGIMISNGLLNTLDGASSNGVTSTISAKVFVSAAYNCNRIRKAGSTKVPVGLGSEEVNMLGYDTGNWKIAADLVDNWFGNGSTVKLKNGASADTSVFFKYTIWPSLGNLLSASPKNGYKVFSLFDTEAVLYYYDLWEFNYILGFVGISFITMTFLSLLLGLAKRAIDLAILFVISPPIIAVMPLDNGQMFGKWKTEFVKRVLNTYAPVVAMNLYLIIMPMIMNIDIFRSVVKSMQTGVSFTLLEASVETTTPGIDAAADLLAGPIAFLVNSIFQLVMIIAGAIAVKSSIDWISDLIGAENLAKTSKEMNDGAMQMGAKAVAVGANVGGLAMGGINKARAALSKDPEKAAALNAKADASFKRVGQSMAAMNPMKGFIDKTNELVDPVGTKEKQAYKEAKARDAAQNRLEEEQLKDGTKKERALRDNAFRQDVQNTVDAQNKAQDAAATQQALNNSGLAKFAQKDEDKSGNHAEADAKGDNMTAALAKIAQEIQKLGLAGIKAGAEKNGENGYHAGLQNLLAHINTPESERKEGVQYDISKMTGSEMKQAVGGDAAWKNFSAHFNIKIDKETNTVVPKEEK